MYNGRIIEHELKHQSSVLCDETKAHTYYILTAGKKSSIPTCRYNILYFYTYQIQFLINTQYNNKNI